LLFFTSQNIFIENCVIYSKEVSALYLSESSAVIKNCVLMDSGQCAVNIQNCENVEVIGCKISKVQFGIYAKRTEIVKIKDTEISKCDYGVTGFDDKSLELHNVKVYNCAHVGFRSNTCFDVLFDTCHFLNSMTNVYFYEKNENARIINSKIEGASRHSGVYSSSKKLHIENSEILNSSQYGVSVNGNTKITISSCKIYDNNLSVIGIWTETVEESGGVVASFDIITFSLDVENCTITNNKDSGIYISGDSDSQIRILNNSIIKNSNGSIEIEKDNGNINISDNTLDANIPLKVFLKNYSEENNQLPQIISFSNNRSEFGGPELNNIKYKKWFITAKEEGILEKDKVSPEVMLAIEKKMCTASVTRKHFFLQKWRECITCGLMNGEGVCVVCAEICHAGHTLTEEKTSSFYCDCGTGKRCKCFQNL